eukprot:GHVH01006985.1.p1 GENE.GHVH01006985.1~~GHVH01006985.1.p1  ORF type:complete len:237 (+),score=30.26 GHVH01006985.1:619-1329(+)
MSKRVIVVGGGAVSTEFSGYLHDQNPAGVFLCIRKDKIFEQLTVSMSNTATKQLEAMLGDRFIKCAVPSNSFNDEVDPDFPNFVFFDSPRSVVLTNGASIDNVDMIFFGFSKRSVVPVVDVLIGDSSLVDRKSMTSVKHHDIHVIGDLVTFKNPSPGDMNMAYLAMLQSSSVANDHEYKERYNRALISPFGKHHGVALIPVPLVGECCVGNFVTQKLSSLKFSMNKKTLISMFGED